MKYIALNIFFFIPGTMHFNDQLMSELGTGHWKCHFSPRSWYCIRKSFKLFPSFF